MTTALILLAGVIAAAGGGELFVRGAVGVATWARIPATIVAVTIAAFATSSPELFVAINAAAQDQSTIAFGDAVGSNVVNVGLILGLALLIRPAPIERQSARRDLPVALAVPAITLLLVADGSLSRLDGALLLMAFVAWLTVTVHHARRARRTQDADLLDVDGHDANVVEAEVLGEPHRPRAVAEMIVGLGLLVIAGRLIVVAAESIGGALGLDPFVVGATFVAIGTSMPELATTLAAGLRGHEEVGIGAIVGSNIFNGLWIVAVTALLRPFRVDVSEVALGLVAGVVVIGLILPGRRLWLARRRGALLLATYAAYLTLLLALRPHA
jgi:cation:H+ antiporter